MIDVLRSKTKLENKTALITGAGSGIGQAISLSLAKRGCHLILTDINQQGLDQTKKICNELQVNIETFILDVASDESVKSLAEKIEQKYSTLDLLINNAGVAMGGRFQNIAKDDFDKVMEINFFGTVRMCREFFQLLHKTKNSRIVNLSSLFGIIAPAGQTSYCASKFAVRGFSHSLAHELEDTNISVSVVHPGGVSTSIAQNAILDSSLSEEDLARGRKKFEKSLKMPPSEAGEIIVKGIERRKDIIYVGSDSIAVSLLERMFPVKHWSLLKGQL